MLVVSVGTAMTVDALNADGVFPGGVIVPGVTLMRQALRPDVGRVQRWGAVRGRVVRFSPRPAAGLVFQERL